MPTNTEGPVTEGPDVRTATSLTLVLLLLVILAAAVVQLVRAAGA